jgi:hypothetical protein
MIVKSRRKSVIPKSAAAALFLACAFQASATAVSPYIDTPTAITGAPGSIVGWDFTIHNPTAYWITFIDSSWAQSTPSDGNADPNYGSSGYADYIGFTGGPQPDLGVAPGATWSLIFSLAGTQPYPGPTPGSIPPGTGIGQFAIDPGAVVGGTDTGFATIHFLYYDGSPAGFPSGNPVLDDGSPNPGFTEYVLTLQDGVTLPTLTVNIVPEPSTTLPLAAIGAVCVISALRRRSQESVVAQHHQDCARARGAGQGAISGLKRSAELECERAFSRRVF